MSLELTVIADKAVVVRRAKTTVAALWFGSRVFRPFIYPFLGPQDREVTRLGHPLDPIGHSHHRSIWIAHADVNGVNFWAESRNTGRIEAEEVHVAKNRGRSVESVVDCAWKGPDGKTILAEKRSLRFTDLANGELALDIDSTLRPGRRDTPVTLGATPFGLLGIRVARTLRVHERLGGAILNSQEGENESGCFWQHAEWCDYSGPVPLPGAEPPKREPGKPPVPKPSPAPPAWLKLGICCFVDPENTQADGTLWHVRDDGWMGPCLSKDQAIKLTKDKALRVRFRLESHAGGPGQAAVPARYQAWRKRLPRR